MQPWAVETYPAAAHIDNTARPQGVKQADDPWMHSLLLSVAQAHASTASGKGVARTAAILINTSLNSKGKPIVADVLDVLRIFCESGGEQLDLVLLEEKWLFNRSAALI